MNGFQWRTLTVIAALLGVAAGEANASDACATTAIVTSAEVEASDGLRYRVETYYQGPDTAAARFVGEQVRLVAVEGGLSWGRNDDGARIDGAGSRDTLRNFVLGHQYHALLLHFDEIVGEPQDTAAIEFDGRAWPARSGAAPGGGVLHRLHDPATGRAVALVFDLPEMERMTASYDDWRGDGDRALPFRVRIDDGSRTFDYRFDSVDTSPRNSQWFMDRFPADALDELAVYRLHRRLLAAHCDGDAATLAALSGPEVVVAGRGELQRTTPDSMRERFGQVFESLDYTAYVDLQAPIVGLSADASAGWIAVEVEARGNVRASGEPFRSQWAWIMLVEKVDGAWRHVGNASNVRPPDP